jgi:hypothetical protein
MMISEDSRVKPDAESIDNTTQATQANKSSNQRKAETGISITVGALEKKVENSSLLNYQDEAGENNKYFENPYLYDCSGPK